MGTLLKHFLHDHSGATVVEYSLVIAGIALATVVAMGILGGNLGTAFDSIAAALL
ncbi:MAG: Flp family type IVb pilin [Devosiaceae bacterium]